MATHKARLMAALRGEQVDRLPYVPRLDLWYLANASCGTLPPQHAGRSMNEIARAEGWPLYFRFADDQLDPAIEQDYLHRGIGLYRSRDTVCDYVMPREVEVKVRHEGSRRRVEYHTPVGMVSTTVHYDAESQRLGITIPALVEHLIKTPDDYGPAGYLFEHIDAAPNFERFRRWSAEELREDGVPVATGFLGASPIHEIQRDLIDPTRFFLHYNDHYPRMRELAERMTPLFDKTLAILADSPAEVVWWGANFDDMITYAPYFAREIQPWIDKVAQRLAGAGKLLLCHTDGENEGLMDLIRDSGMHVAESICPAPMTKITLEEYYRRWSPRLTLLGGIPSTVVLPETSEADFEAFLDQAFQALAPGRRMLLGIADQVPPHAIFSRLQRIAERVEREGRLPLAAGAFRARGPEPPAARRVAAVAPAEGDALFAQVRDAVFKGRHLEIRGQVQALVDRGVPAAEILERGLIAAIDVVGKRMATGEIFIPQVLLAARAMSAGVGALEPHLARSAGRQSGTVVIGTVTGDMHDIGKNLVVTLLRGVGFEVCDLGVNVSRERFCEAVASERADILGLSALLTQTMVEMRAVIQALEAHGLRTRCKVMVGGAPVTEGFARQIGADGFAADAVAAVQLTRRLLASPAATPNA